MRGAGNLKCVLRLAVLTRVCFAACVRSVSMSSGTGRRGMSKSLILRSSLTCEIGRIKCDASGQLAVGVTVSR
eukprot:528996-Rhodomonas_salina.2